jgi:hypothetical protein
MLIKMFFKKIKIKSQAWWFSSVIPATWETETRGNC